MIMTGVKRQHFLVPNLYSIILSLGVGLNSQSEFPKSLSSVSKSAVR